MYTIEIPVNQNTAAIKPFFEDTENLNIILFKDGIVLSAFKDNDVYYQLKIDKDDIHKIKLDDPNWAISRSFTASQLTELIEKPVTKAGDVFFRINVDEAGTYMKVEKISSKGHSMREPKNIILNNQEQHVTYDDPTYAKAVVQISDFKQILKKLKPSSSEDIMVEWQDSYVRFYSDGLNESCIEGIHNPSLPLNRKYVSKEVIKRIDKIRIGNLKHGVVGIYINKQEQLVIKVKIGITHFLIIGPTYNKEQ